MFRIMIIKSKRDDFKTLYQYLTETIEEEVNGETVKTVRPVELEDEEAVDTKVEEMLNEGGYAKSDFIVVKVINYTIDAVIDEEVTE